jgi:hypothetical protein
MEDVGDPARTYLPSIFISWGRGREHYKDADSSPILGLIRLSMVYAKEVSCTWYHNGMHI